MTVQDAQDRHHIVGTHVLVDHEVGIHDGDSDSAAKARPQRPALWEVAELCIEAPELGAKSLSDAQTSFRSR
jgi:hypothetical protein